MNKWCVKKIYLESTERVVCEYVVEGEWEKYFSKQRSSFIEYPSNNIDVGIPEAVLAVPFVCNVLPVAWLCDAEMVVPELDADFFEHISEIKKGYEEMYPMLSFNGKVLTKPIRSQCKVKKGDAAALFSGGVDAYTTFLRNEKNVRWLLTIWGADIALDDEVGWKHVRTHTEDVAEEYEKKAIAIQSDFRKVLDEGCLDGMVKASGDLWWHGFQHGIALIGHVAPLAYILGMESLYIASSFPSNMKGCYTCASDPIIDNHVHFCGCNTIHDGYEMDRQQKVAYCLKRKEESGKDISFRVCWESHGGENCSQCEKCYRTILEIVSEGGDPNQFGFSWDKGHIRQCRKDMKGKVVLQEYNVKQFYPIIQDRMRLNKEAIDNYDDYNWLLEMDFSKFNDYPIKRLCNSRPYRILKRIWGSLINGRNI